MQHLSLKVRLVDDIGVDDGQMPDAGRRKIEKEWRAKAPRANHQKARLVQPTLPLHADFRDEKMAVIATEFVRRHEGVDG